MIKMRILLLAVFLLLICVAVQRLVAEIREKTKKEAEDETL